MASYLPILRAGSNPTRCVLLGEPVEVKLHYTKEEGSFPCAGQTCNFCPRRASFRWFYPAAKIMPSDQIVRPTADQLSQWEMSHRVWHTNGRRGSEPERPREYKQQVLGVLGIAEVPDAQHEELADHEPRSIIIELSKKNADRFSPVLIEVKGRWPRDLPPAFDVVPYLERIWGMSLPKNEVAAEEAPAILRFKVG